MYRNDDELLSAYLDGELDEAQRIEVEQRLEQEPAARELLSQLQSVSESVGALPKYGLGADLREAVLSQVEVRRREELPEEGSFRRWAYAAAAIAAALLLTVYQPSQQGDDQQVAGLLRGSNPKLSPDATLNASDPDQRAALGSFGSLWGNKKQLSLSEIVERSLSNGVAQPSREQLHGDQLGDAPLEDFHVHLHSADADSGLREFEQLLNRSGIVLFGGSSISDGDADSVDLEMILLEAPLFAVRQIVAGCGQDQSVWKSAQILRPNKSAPSILFLTFPKGRSETIGGAEFRRPELSKAFADVKPQGWAKHLNRDRLEPELAAGFDSGPSARGQGTIRVLFFLHPAAE